MEQFIESYCSEPRLALNRLVVTRFRFEAYVRRAKFQPRGSRVQCGRSGDSKRLNFTTESMPGTNDWKRIEQAFQVLPGTELVKMCLVRKPPLRFDTLIRGTVWVDDVRIRPEREGVAAGDGSASRGGSRIESSEPGVAGGYTFRKSSVVRPACFKIARSVPSGISPG